ELVNVQGYERKNPRDLSFGEKERVALASILAAEPKLLFLDEPTRGLDPESKHFLGSLFSEWVREQNRTIVMASQDIEFVAEYADEVIWIGHGKILQAGSARDVLEDNLFFSTQVNRLFRGFAKKVLTVSDARKKIASFTTHHLLHPVPREASSAKMARNGLVSPKKIFPEATVVKPWYGVHEQ
ncbi:MAG: energy-coupling factor ABC transporter ATP-binding protein, partial [Candidatus Omnitrophica bacterium]|nr:energy-coupling factor ABC transporter ATP-binding protein [Candidatus Omnitrophota bacterium]